MSRNPSNGWWTLEELVARHLRDPGPYALCVLSAVQVKWQILTKESTVQRTAWLATRNARIRLFFSQALCLSPAVCLFVCLFRSPHRPWPGPSNWLSLWVSRWCFWPSWPLEAESGFRKSQACGRLVLTETSLCHMYSKRRLFFPTACSAGGAHIRSIHYYSHLPCKQSSVWRNVLNCACIHRSTKDIPPTVQQRNAASVLVPRNGSCESRAHIKEPLALCLPIRAKSL